MTTSVAELPTSPAASSAEIELGRVEYAPGPAIMKCTDPDSTRFALNGINVRPSGDDHVVFVACEGRMLVATRTEGHVDRPRVLNTKSIPTGRRKHDDGPDIVFNSSNVKNRKWVVSPYVDGRFPEDRDVIPSVRYDSSKPCLKADGSDVEYLPVRLDARLLVRLLEAVAHENDQGICAVDMLIPRSGRQYAVSPVVVTSIAGQSIGVIQPFGPGTLEQEEQHLSQVCETIASIRK